MADNYLEKKFEDMRARVQAKQAREQRIRHRAWKKRMEAYRRKLESSSAAGAEVPDALDGEVASEA